MVGSAGILNQADLAKVTLHQSVIQLGTEIVIQPQVGTVAAAALVGPVNFPMVQAVARYNVTSVDGLFNSAPFKYKLLLRCRGNVSANLIEVNLVSGVEKTRIKFT